MVTNSSFIIHFVYIQFLLIHSNNPVFLLCWLIHEGGVADSPPWGGISCYDGQNVLTALHPSEHLPHQVVTVRQALPGQARRWPSIDALIQRPLEERGFYARSSDGLLSLHHQHTDTDTDNNAPHAPGSGETTTHWLVLLALTPEQNSIVWGPIQATYIHQYKITNCLGWLCVLNLWNKYNIADREAATNIFFT